MTNTSTNIPIIYMVGKMIILDGEWIFLLCAGSPCRAPKVGEAKISNLQSYKSQLILPYTFVQRFSWFSLFTTIFKILLPFCVSSKSNFHFGKSLFDAYGCIALWYITLMFILASRRRFSAFRSRCTTRLIKNIKSYQFKKTPESFANIKSQVFQQKKDQQRTPFNPFERRQLIEVTDALFFHPVSLYDKEKGVQTSAAESSV